MENESGIHESTQPDLAIKKRTLRIPPAGLVVSLITFALGLFIGNTLTLFLTSSQDVSSALKPESSKTTVMDGEEIYVIQVQDTGNRLLKINPDGSTNIVPEQNYDSKNNILILRESEHDEYVLQKQEGCDDSQCDARVIQFASDGTSQVVLNDVATKHGVAATLLTPIVGDADKVPKGENMLIIQKLTAGSRYIVVDEDGTSELVSQAEGVTIHNADSLKIIELAAEQSYFIQKDRSCQYGECSLRVIHILPDGSTEILVNDIENTLFNGGGSRGSHLEIFLQDKNSDTLVFIHYFGSSACCSLYTLTESADELVPLIHGHIDYHSKDLVSPDNRKILRMHENETQLLVTDIASDTETTVAEVSNGETLTELIDGYGADPNGHYTWVDNNTVEYHVFDSAEPLDNFESKRTAIDVRQLNLIN